MGFAGHVRRRGRTEVNGRVCRRLNKDEDNIGSRTERERQAHAGCRGVATTPGGWNGLDSSEAAGVGEVADSPLPDPPAQE